MELGSNGETLVSRTARALTTLSLGSDDGAYLGAEVDLLARLGVSRPTLRQAAKIVESDRLISVRRGTRGGFYAERPDAADAIKALTRYLRLNGATIADIIVVSRNISEEAAGLAAACRDASLRMQLQAFQSRIDGHDTPGSIIRAETELARLIALMSGNPAIQLVMEIGYTFGMEEQPGSLYRSDEDRAVARRLQHDLCTAVLGGDADVARLMMQRRSKSMGAWLARDGAGA
jgi:GntR family transcriptional regulator, transcriptional repressor for pyruvate dehydrogenase complex